ncbi:MAG: sulfur carrier protein ThiS [Chitinivibrionales bacterium]|nr:sulfur carrier protein ThiS [Chitinivibrionales bacterium]
MQISVNGKEKEIEQSCTLTGFLTQEQIDTQYIVIELNGKIITRNRWPQVELNHGDILEIVRFVGGG